MPQVDIGDHRYFENRFEEIWEKGSMGPRSMRELLDFYIKCGCECESCVMNTVKHVIEKYNIKHYQVHEWVRKTTTYKENIERFEGYFSKFYHGETNAADAKQ